MPVQVPVKRLSLAEMEQRKADSLALKRLMLWLEKEELTHDVLSERAVWALRTVLAGEAA